MNRATMAIWASSFVSIQIGNYISNNRTKVEEVAPRRKSLTPPSELPNGTESRVGDNLGEAFGQPYFTITPWLQANGYGASLPGEFTDMTSMGPLGLLVISSHGGTGQWRDGSTAYAIWGNAFDVAPHKDDIYKNELDEHRLCYMYADTGYELKKVENQWRYAFTAKYVMEYLEFEKGSLVFIDACSSDDPVMKGASVYVGWSSPVNSGKACIASKYMFDRLLGANEYNPESPKQRPFDWKSVWSWMQENVYDIGQNAGGCYLMMTEGEGSGNGFGVLAPSLQFVFVHPYDEELYLYGLFGDDPGADGQVTVGGAAIQVKEWGRGSQTSLDRIVCEIPYEGSGSSGDVEVTVRNHKSNKRQLSFYEGDVKLRHDTGDGRYFEITHHLRFRVDLQSFRTKPHEDPEYMLSGSIQTGITETITAEGGSTSLPKPVIIGLDEFDGKENNHPPYVEFSLNEDFGFPQVERNAQKVAVSFSYLAYNLDTVTVSFDPISCQSPPDPEAAR